MNKPIVIQGAMQSEIDSLLEKFNVKQENVFGGYVFYECEYKGYPVIISKTKIGEISSAIATTICIERYNPLLIINQGTAGASVEWLDKEDIILGKDIYYISQFSTDENKEVEEINPWKKDEYRTLDDERISYKANEKLIEWLRGLEILNKSNIYFETIGSGDIWTKTAETMEKYNRNYGIVCEAMECSGAYMAANSFEIPIVSIRVISNNELKNQEFDPDIAIHAQNLVVDIVDEFVCQGGRFYLTEERRNKIYVWYCWICRGEGREGRHSFWIKEVRV